MLKKLLKSLLGGSHKRYSSSDYHKHSYKKFSSSDHGKKHYGKSHGHSYYKGKRRKSGFFSS
ncbi:hypothetical protein M1K46_14135 [Fictibacillus sp. WQ 8-8]|uniref:hypothetical protein n=1 Tax=unclassified Fictibacillus TaxID=2644029 RepID=UPI0006A7599C|nr:MULTISPECIES: hypothetical protein [unclassified Fictibacillus]MCQ6266793.1 hypothetical protein [Fictibacillus sp. WQ 8-8]MED2973836.1 hypothetical protein [Fictibacillus sp. B-59209]